MCQIQRRRIAITRRRQQALHVGVRSPRVGGCVIAWAWHVDLRCAVCTLTLIARRRLACGQRTADAIDPIQHQTHGTTCRHGDATTQVADIVAVVRDDPAVFLGQSSRIRILQRGAIRPAIAVHGKKVVHAVRAAGHHGCGQRHVPLQQVANDVVVVSRPMQGVDLLRRRIGSHLAIVRTGGADGVHRHHVIHDAIASLRDPPIQAG
ncbi:MAG: hypothetical protein DI537_42520, partial [Stutzerimonas stutzeri]